MKAAISLHMWSTRIPLDFRANPYNREIMIDPDKHDNILAVENTTSTIYEH